MYCCAKNCSLKIRVSGEGNSSWQWSMECSRLVINMRSNFCRQILLQCSYTCATTPGITLDDYNTQSSLKALRVSLISSVTWKTILVLCSGVVCDCHSVSSGDDMAEYGCNMGAYNSYGLLCEHEFPDHLQLVDTELLHGHPCRSSSCGEFCCIHSLAVNSYHFHHS